MPLTGSIHVGCRGIAAINVSRFAGPAAVFLLGGAGRLEAWLAGRRIGGVCAGRAESGFASMSATGFVRVAGVKARACDRALCAAWP
jgi:hypothetical protein